MPVVGIGIRKIEASRNELSERGMGVGQSPHVKDMKKTKIDALGAEGLEISYEYVFDYKGADRKKLIANITFSGEAVYLPEKGDDLEELLAKWKKEKRVPSKIFVPVVNTIIRRCVSRALVLAEDLNLPPPINIPIVRIEKKKKDVEAG
ncbi:MAG: hypothetical protein HYS81_04120 [Candidatus Aenigmatarchaeota archaeon]|nr:MAG: hypothetical protein HYS81_04120 [Candidatus Aenigmarchaeota archaeon]